VTGPSFEALGFWIIPLAAFTLTATVASLGRDLGLTAVLACLTAASAFAAAGYISGSRWPETTAGWLFVFAAAFAWYTASALLLESSYRRTALPSFRRHGPASAPWGEDAYPDEATAGWRRTRVHR
jgi:succinate-acetate transporter protein